MMYKNLLFRTKTIFPFFWQLTTWPIGLIIIKLCNNLTISGRENIKFAENEKRNGKSVIFIANHMSDLDGILMLSGISPMSSLFPLFYVARTHKKYEWESWRRFVYQDWFFSLIGAYPSHEGFGDYSISLRDHVKLLQLGKTVAIFPEGKFRKIASQSLPAHGGAAYLAEAVGALIVPIYIEGVFKFNRDNTNRKNKISITYGEPFAYNNASSHTDALGNKYKDMAEYMMKKVDLLHANSAI